jgi:uncharacterized protein DUF4129
VRRLVLIVLVAGLAVPVAAADDRGTQPNTTDRIEKARSTVLTDEYQKELPGSEIGDGSGNGGIGDVGEGDGEGGSGSGSRDGSGGWLRHHPRERRVEFRGDRHRIDTRDYEGQQDTGMLGSITTFIMWGVVIVGCALLLFWLASELLRYGGDETSLAEEPKASDSAVDMRVIERPLGDAEELARRGEYREAIHTLLLRTLQELVRSASVRVAPAMTSREILARVPLLADAREALSGLITAVEITHFGGDEATLDDYIRCRDQFHRFATAFRAASERAAMGGGGTSLVGAA